MRLSRSKHNCSSSWYQFAMIWNQKGKKMCNLEIHHTYNALLHSFPQLGKLQAKLQANLPVTGNSNWKRAKLVISNHTPSHTARTCRHPAIVATTLPKNCRILTFIVTRSYVIMFYKHKLTGQKQTHNVIHSCSEKLDLHGRISHAKTKLRETKSEVFAALTSLTGTRLFWGWKLCCTFDPYFFLNCWTLKWRKTEQQHAFLV